jgi:mersacidin/lichenicidin family type 2 lantibiotic
MSNEMIVRAWKDTKFRAQLGAPVPGNPAGEARLVASDLAGENYLTSPVCTIGPRCPTNSGPNCLA